MPPLPLVPARLPAGPWYGALARFETPAALVHACERVRDAGYTRWDAHSPFPVHGLDRAMGLRPSKLPWIVLVLGLTGSSAALALQGWIHTTAYPLVISGKPLFSWQAFVPVTFEVGVLFGAIGAVVGILALGQLPMHWHPLFSSRAFERASDDAFFISVESWDPRFDPQRTLEELQRFGAAAVELVDAEPRGVAA